MQASYLNNTAAVVDNDVVFFFFLKLAAIVALYIHPIRHTVYVAGKESEGGRGELKFPHHGSIWGSAAWQNTRRG